MWDLNSNKMPGEVFKEGLYDIKKTKNNYIVADNINQKEMIGLGMVR